MSMPFITLRMGDVPPGAGQKSQPTARSAMAGPGLLPRSVCRPPAGMVLVNRPGVMPVTSAVMTQVPGDPAGICAPDARVMLLPPAVPETPLPPLQVVLIVNGVASVTPAGKESTRLAVNVAVAGFGLARVMVSVLLAPATMLSGLNALATVGGCG